MRTPTLLMRVLGRRVVDADMEFAEEVVREHDPGRRRLLGERIEDHDADVFVLDGDGVIVPGLPTGTEADLGHAFERDAERPPDLAP